VPLTLKHNFAQRVESSRAVVFLLDGQGRVAGQFMKRVGASAFPKRLCWMRAPTVFKVVGGTFSTWDWQEHGCEMPEFPAVQDPTELPPSVQAMLPPAFQSS
jgi:hypothetical protein